MVLLCPAPPRAARPAPPRPPRPRAVAGAGVRRLPALRSTSSRAAISSFHTAMSLPLTVLRTLPGRQFTCQYSLTYVVPPIGMYFRSLGSPCLNVAPHDRHGARDMWIGRGTVHLTSAVFTPGVAVTAAAAATVLPPPAAAASPSSPSTAAPLLLPPPPLPPRPSGAAAPPPSTPPPPLATPLGALAPAASAEPRATAVRPPFATAAGLARPTATPPAAPPSPPARPSPPRAARPSPPPPPRSPKTNGEKWPGTNSTSASRGGQLSERSIHSISSAIRT